MNRGVTLKKRATKLKRILENLWPPNRTTWEGCSTGVPRYRAQFGVCYAPREALLARSQTPCRLFFSLETPYLPRSTVTAKFPSRKRGTDRSVTLSRTYTRASNARACITICERLCVIPCSPCILSLYFLLLFRKIPPSQRILASCQWILI